jgi:hypothetical protein
MAGGAGELAAICEDVAGLVDRGDWHRARWAADAAVGSGQGVCRAAGSSTAVGEDDTSCHAMVRWLASVWACGAWRGGCAAECAMALQLARGLEVSAAHERRRLVGLSNGSLSEVEEEAYRTALHGNQLCCAIALGVQCGQNEQELSAGGGAAAAGTGAWQGQGTGGERWGVTRLTLKKHLHEMGRLVKAAASRAAGCLARQRPSDVEVAFLSHTRLAADCRLPLWTIACPRASNAACLACRCVLLVVLKC